MNELSHAEDSLNSNNKNINKNSSQLMQAQLCGSKCPNCARPCRGYSGHDLPHECNQHHSW